MALGVGWGTRIFEEVEDVDGNVKEVDANVEDDTLEDALADGTVNANGVLPASSLKQRNT